MCPSDQDERTGRAPFYRRWYFFAGVGLLGAALGLALLYWQAQVLLSPVSAGEEVREVEVLVPVGSSPRQVAEKLEEKGVIRDARVFNLYARYTGYAEGMQAGRYTFDTSMDADQILAALQEGLLLREGPRFTIPEGFTVKQVAQRLDEAGKADQEAFLELACNYREHGSFEPLEEAPEELYCDLEGYLFPDTYEVSEDVTEEELLELMLSRFRGVFNDEYRSRAEELGMSVHEAVTLASLVEREARVADEQPLIAAVFHNRLQTETMPFLQSCATVMYALGEVKTHLTYRDLEVDSIYNTYRRPHLPPGPIASPGQKALDAALYPADVNYLYFVYKEDGSGEHYFSTTLQEHNRYKEKARQNRQ